MDKHATDIFQMFDLRGNDLVLLIMYRTQAIVSPEWPGKKITERCINGDKQRVDLQFEYQAVSSIREIADDLANIGCLERKVSLIE